MGYCFGVKVGRLRGDVARESDERISNLEEMITCIAVVKMYCWESFIVSKIIQFRRNETYYLQWRALYQGLAKAIPIFSPHLVLIATMLAHLYIGEGHLRASDIFLVMTLCNVLNVYTKLTIMMLYDFVEMFNVNQRVKEVLLLPEGKKQVHPVTDTVTIVDLSARYPNNNQNSLENINVQLDKGQLLGVIGPVGAGKSSLLSLLLGELETTSGTISRPSSVSVAPQTPWIFSGSIRDNIIMHYPFDADRYADVIGATCLVNDLERFTAAGDQTLVGEKGVTLSGGQKSRVSLARALYAQAELYLLDDPLAAVDAHVGRCIYEQCIKGYLRNATCILVTHQCHFLVDADHILLLDNGCQTFCGRYNELIHQELDFVASLSKGT